MEYCGWEANLLPRKKHRGAIGLEAWWVLGSVWTLWRSQESLNLAGNRNTIPQSIPWPCHYRLNHLGSSAVLEELVVLLLSLVLIISLEAQWYVLFEEFQLVQCASVQTWLLERNLELGSVLGIIHAHKVCKMLLPRTFPYLFRLTT